jgi:enoyl-CoA hydratase/carnithine racemase
MPSLRLEFLEDGLALVTFDQSGSKANTLGQAILAEFEQVLDQLEAKSGLRGLILASGKPGMFIAGADLKELGDARLEPAQTRQLVERGLNMIGRIE